MVPAASEKRSIAMIGSLEAIAAHRVEAADVVNVDVGKLRRRYSRPRRTFRCPTAAGRRVERICRIQQSR